MFYYLLHFTRQRFMFIVTNKVWIFFKLSYLFCKYMHKETGNVMSPSLKDGR